MSDKNPENMKPEESYMDRQERIANNPEPLIDHVDTEEIRLAEKPENMSVGEIREAATIEENYFSGHKRSLAVKVSSGQYTVDYLPIANFIDLIAAAASRDAQKRIAELEKKYRRALVEKCNTCLGQDNECNDVIIDIDDAIENCHALDKYYSNDNNFNADGSLKEGGG